MELVAQLVSLKGLEQELLQAVKFNPAWESLLIDCQEDIQDIEVLLDAKRELARLKSQRVVDFNAYRRAAGVS